MASHEIGTPSGAERKQRRMHSPPQEMDDGDEETQFIRRPQFDVEPHTPVQGAQSVTLEGIRGLFQEEIAPMKSSMVGLQQQLSELRVSADHRFNAIDLRLGEAEKNIQRLEQDRSGISSPVSEQSWASWTSQITALQKELNDIRMQSKAPPQPSQENRDCVAVVGGLGNLQSTEAAEEWLSDKLWTAYGPQMSGAFSKGDFHGIIFAKFENKTDRDKAIHVLRKMRLKEGNVDVWIKPDKPLEARVLSSLVFGTKYSMNQQGFDKWALWADVDESANKSELWLGGEKIIEATIVDNDLKLAYSDGWQDWFMHKDYTEFAQSIDALRAKLAATKGAGKGQGKSKSGKAAGKGKGPE